jgi:hypothetical protein
MKTVHEFIEKNRIFKPPSGLKDETTPHVKRPE